MIIPYIMKKQVPKHQPGLMFTNLAIHYGGPALEGLFTSDPRFSNALPYWQIHCHDQGEVISSIHLLSPWGYGDANYHWDGIELQIMGIEVIQSNNNYHIQKLIHSIHSKNIGMLSKKTDSI